MLSFAKHLFSYSYPLSFERLNSRCLCAGALNPSILSAYSVYAWYLVLSRVRWPTRKAFVLRTDAAFAAPGLPNVCWRRNVGSRATKRYGGAAFGVLVEHFVLIGMVDVGRLVGW